MSQDSETPEEPKSQSVEPQFVEPELIEDLEGGNLPSLPKAEEETIEQPSKVIRMGAMLGQLLEEVRSANIDEAGRERLKEIYELSVKELGSAVSEDLREELLRLVQPFGEGEIPSESELRVAKAQLVGWLEGLVQGIQATLYAQQIAAGQQLANMRREIGQPPGSPQEESPQKRPHGTYL